MSAKPMGEDYNETTARWSLECGRFSIEPMRNALKQMQKEDPERFMRLNETFVIADYGVATGFASIEALCTLIQGIREFSPKLPIAIYLNDLPENHHEIAIKTIEKGLNDHLPESLNHDIFLYVAGKDFTKQVFPEGFVDFGFSAMAATTLPQAAGELTNSYFVSSPKVLATEAGQRWENAFTEFYTAFIRQRSTELKRGGYFCMVTSTYSEKPEIRAYQDKEEQFYQGLHDTLQTLFAKHGLSHLLSRCLYTWSIVTAEPCCWEPTRKAGLEIVDSLEYLVPDLFCLESKSQEELAEKVAHHQSNYWYQTIRDNLRDAGVPEA